MPGVADTPLFVPGNGPERFDKAAASGATHVILDLEDGVGATDKEEARMAVARWLEINRGTVRINALGTVDGAVDLLWLESLVHGPETVLVAKVKSPDDIDVVASVISERISVVVLIESARGIASLERIAEHPRVERLAFGGVDFALDVGVSSYSAVVTAARAQIVIASRAACIAQPWDAPTLDFKDAKQVEHDARQAKDDGFAGKLCIHPNQVDMVFKAFAPSAEEVAWAHRVITRGEGASQLDGAMVDRPVVERARKVLAAAEATAAMQGGLP
ncbi:CoA ester lyase [Cryobacterium sp. Y50]|uniref:HpcH/HpaI aldolase/citrate lyase family protein n=1 Tax=Cryobacterium sp. Y50 TaxID=2048286 RepID=UPI000CE4C909|nr:CoA ester lyase [Cryobacterium sp. Y50]